MKSIKETTRAPGSKARWNMVDLTLRCGKKLGMAQVSEPGCCTRPSLSWDAGQQML